MRFFSTILVAATACCSSAFTVKNSIRAASAIGAAPVDRDALNNLSLADLARLRHAGDAGGCHRLFLGRQMPDLGRYRPM